jgi:protein gp37
MGLAFDGSRRRAEIGLDHQPWRFSVRRRHIAWPAAAACAVWTRKIICDEMSLDVPREWSKPRRIFVNSMSDLFREGVPSTFVQMAETPRHTYQILTKRPDQMEAAFPP